MIDIQNLKALAEAATPGRNFDRLPEAGGGLKYECSGDDGSLVLKVDHKNDEWGFVGDRGEQDEAFFLACTPAAVLELIADLESSAHGYDLLRGELDLALSDIIAFKGAISSLGEACKKLTFCARTTGGTAGPDADLMGACEAAENALSLVGVSKAMDYIEDLKAENERLRIDSARLDRLEMECEAYGTDIHEGNRWVVDGPFATVRDAIDACMRQEGRS